MYIPANDEGYIAADLVDIRRTATEYLTDNKDAKQMPVYTSHTMKR